MHNQVRACYDAIEHLDKFFGPTQVSNINSRRIEHLKHGLYLLASEIANEAYASINAVILDKTLEGPNNAS